MKTLSLKSDASLSELQTKLSQLWSRPLESLSFFTAEGQPLETEEKWQELRDSSHIEVPQLFGKWLEMAVVTHGNPVVGW